MSEVSMSATVLIVDDSASVRQQVASALSLGGFQVVEACDGEEGMGRINAGGIDCVICDINMPIMNGIEMVEEVLRNEAHRTLPILMLTTEGAWELIERAKKAGARGWMVKPFKADLLLVAVQKLTGIACGS
jgi:two-component system chemotaxis response regulator CheY